MEFWLAFGTREVTNRRKGAGKFDAVFCATVVGFRICQQAMRSTTVTLPAFFKVLDISGRFEDRVRAQRAMISKERDGVPCDIAIGEIWAHLMAIKMVWVVWQKSIAWLEMHLTARSADVLYCQRAGDKDTTNPFWLHVSDNGSFDLGFSGLTCLTNTIPRRAK